MAPLLAGSAAATLGWKWGMWAPGMIGVVVGFILVLGVKEPPYCGFVAPGTKNANPIVVFGPRG